MERLMQYVWQHRLWPHQQMMTVDGRPVQVLDPGRLNTDAGPDFFNAKVKIAGHLWAGDVEIHVRASDWHRHHHDGDRAYDSVVLHVVDRDDTLIRRSNGEVIPQMCMPCSPNLNADYRALVERSDIDLPCAAHIPAITPIHLTDWLSALTFERLHAKSDRIEHLKSFTAGDDNEACYVLLARSLGFGTNSEPMERLARSLPWRFIAKHRDSLVAVEALLFGQSGMLEPLMAGGEPHDAYLKLLVREYRFLAAKFSLKPLESPGWKMGRMRPANFPHRRIAYLAQLLHLRPNLCSDIRLLTDIDQAREYFDIPLTGYWAEHYHFTDNASATPMPRMSRGSIDLIIINVAVPVLFNYGVVHADDGAMTRATDLLASLPAERNSIVAMFNRAGIPSVDAATSQALIHLRRCYCETRKCLYCRLGHRVLSEKAVRQV